MTRKLWSFLFTDRQDIGNHSMAYQTRQDKKNNQITKEANQMYYDDLKKKKTPEIKELLGSLGSIENMNPLILICMDLCDRITRLEERVENSKPQEQETEGKIKNLSFNNDKKTHGDKTSKLKEQLRETARVAQTQQPGEFNPMSWLDLELENNPGSFDSFFDRIWDELTQDEQAQRTIALRRAL